MNIDIQSPDFVITESIKRFVINEAEKHLSAVADHVNKVVIHVRDINGPKGGEDKECKVELLMYEMPSIVLKKRSSDAYMAIKKAITRASRCGLRTLGKRQSARKIATKKMGGGNSELSSGLVEF